jgi:hypothetical protein
VVQDLAIRVRALDQVVHPVEAAQQCALPAARWTDDGRDLVFPDLEGDLLQRAEGAVVGAERLDVEDDLGVAHRDGLSLPSADRHAGANLHGLSLFGDGHAGITSAYRTDCAA